MILVVAEKPSVGQSIAKVLGVKKKNDGYLENDTFTVTWCVGHLIGLAEPEQYDERDKTWTVERLPINPSEWQYAVQKDKGKQFQIIKKLMNQKDVTEIICATDAGREGEVIFRWVYETAKCKKPVKRLWISSMEDTAILNGFENLKDGSELINLYLAGDCRAKADWLVGMNATRLFTKLYNAKISVGRVQTPTLNMLVVREQRINNFRKEKYYTVQISSIPENFIAETESINELEAANTVKHECEGKTAAIKKVEREKKTVPAPHLYDLTTLQRDANRIYGLTAKQTLSIAQELYEAKLITYPRTDSRYLTSDMKETALTVIEKIKSLYPDFASNESKPDIDAVTDNSKVTDHHAIIPTVQLKTVSFPPSDDKSRVLALISLRLLCAVSEKHIYETVRADVMCGRCPFTSKAKVIIQEGWKDIENSFKAAQKLKQDEDEAETVTSLNLVEGKEIEIDACAVKERQTSPPKRYTEDTLLKAMETARKDLYESDEVERKGLGTPATRAGIIEHLVTMKFVERKGKQLIPTDTGTKVISVMPENLKSPAMTAEWENKMTLIAKGELNSNEFLDEISQFVQTVIKEGRASVVQSGTTFITEQTSGKQSIGKCPRCGGQVYEGKNFFFCGNESECKKVSQGHIFMMWKVNKFFNERRVQFSSEIAKELLANGKVMVKGMYSKTRGTTYDALVVLDDTGEKYVNFKLEFTKKGKELKEDA